MKIRSKKALLYDAKFQKTGIVVIKPNYVGLDVNGGASVSFNDFAEIATTLPEGGSTIVESPINNVVFVQETFSAEEIEVQNDKVTPEQGAALSFKEKNDLVVCMAYLEKYKDAKIYGGLVTDWEIVQ